LDYLLIVANNNYSLTDNLIKLPIIVKVAAQSNQIIGQLNGRIKIAISAFAIDNKANKELINFITQTQILEIKKQDVVIAYGMANKLKIIHLPISCKSKLDLILKNIKTE
jgi:uncharacterized protein YggU (UPF0235/DUF167 family)